MIDPATALLASLDQALKDSQTGVNTLRELLPAENGDQGEDLRVVVMQGNAKIAGILQAAGSRG